MNAALKQNQFPRIVRFTGSTSAPDSQCPHCGAAGVHVSYFQTDDGRQLGAMSGCVKLFPVAPIALEELRLTRKLDSLRKRFGSSARLNRADAAALQACEGFYAGTVDERVAMSLCKSARASNAARWIRR